MKKIVVSVLLLLSAVCAHADIFNFGVKGGANFSTLSFDMEGFNQSGRTGFNAGVFGSVNLPIVGLGVQAEALYTLKGCDVTLSGNDYAMKLGYLEVPVYLRWKFNLPIIKPYIGVGPYFGYAVNKNMEDDVFDKDEIKDTDWGFGVTGGVELIDRIQVSLSYQLGIRNIYDVVGDGTMRNRNFAVSVGFMLF